MGGERVTGKVKWFNMKRGFGFIETEKHGDLFVHHTQIRAEGFKALNETAEVELTVSTGDKGPQADDVKQLSEYQKTAYGGRAKRRGKATEGAEGAATEGEAKEGAATEKKARKPRRRNKEKKEGETKDEAPKEGKGRAKREKAKKEPQDEAPKEKTKSTSEWIGEVLAAIDANTSEKVGEVFQDNAVVKIGSAAEVTGKEDALKALFAHYWPESNTPKEVKHEIIKVWSVRGAAIVEANVVTTAADGASSTRPTCLVVSQKKLMVESCRMY